MGFLKRILRNPATEETGSVFTPGSFEALTEEELQTHMSIDNYGAFDLTDAIRPSYDLQVVPKQGFRFDEYVDDTTQARTPVIMAATTSHRIMDLLLDLIDNLGPVVDVVLETSHHFSDTQADLFREHIDVPVLKSILLDHEDLLLNDGCTGIAIISPARRQEVQLDEHKLLIMYGSPLDAFQKTLIDSDVYPDESIKFITEAEHVHSSSEAYYDQFIQLTHRLGMEMDDLTECC